VARRGVREDPQELPPGAPGELPRGDGRTARLRGGRPDGADAWGPGSPRLHEGEAEPARRVKRDRAVGKARLAKARRGAVAAAG
jgi:hypothetical protein